MLVVLVFTALAAFFGTRAVESDIEQRVDQALGEAGFDDITTDASGLTVALKGQYREGQDLDAGIQSVASLVGVGSIDASGVWEIDAAVAVDVEIVGAPVVFTWSGESVTVAGAVSTEEQLIFVEESLAAVSLGEDGEIRFAAIDTGDVEVVEGLASEDEWIGTSIALVGVLASTLNEGSVAVNPSGEVVTTSGKTETRQEKRDLVVATDDLVVALGADGFDFTDGVLGPPKPPAPTKAEVEELDRTLSELIEGKVVEFEFASDQLTDDGTALLDDLLVALVEFPAVSVEIAGHADTDGNADRNLDLSQRRADAVVAYFVSRGESPDRFIAVGYGDTRPIADNSTAAGRQKNRRIEFIALEG